MPYIRTCEFQFNDRVYVDRAGQLFHSHDETVSPNDVWEGSIVFAQKIYSEIDYIPAHITTYTVITKDGCYLLRVKEVAFVDENDNYRSARWELLDISNNEMPEPKPYKNPNGAIICNVLDMYGFEYGIEYCKISENSLEYFTVDMYGDERIVSKGNFNG